MSTEKYKDCVLAAAVNLNLTDVAEALEKSTTPSPQVKKEIELLTKCANIVINEIACDYVPLKKTERIKSDDYRIYYRDLSENIVEIFSVKKDGSSVAIRQFHDCLVLPFDGTYEIEYSYAPLKGTLETSLAWDDERVNSRIVGWGIACEWCILSGLLDDAVLWDKRFKDAVFKKKTPKFEKKIKRRIWI